MQTQTSLLLTQLMKSFQHLPGVGPKSTQRMVFALLKGDRSKGTRLAQLLRRAMLEIGHCTDCRTFTEHTICGICKNPRRQETARICIVENPIDICAIEQTGQFSGCYFVLLGQLSPIENLGPNDIGLDLLEKHLSDKKLREVIIATNPTIAGEATVNYIAGMCARYNVEVSRIAHGIPMGSELEMVDGTTLSHSFLDRKIINNLSKI